jgi:hypothetical protein
MERESDGSAVLIHEVTSLPTLPFACPNVLTVPHFPTHVVVTV